MKAVLTMGNGGYDKLVYREVALPVIQPGDVLIKVLAAGVNNTEINTRLGWYSDSVKNGTEDFSEKQVEKEEKKSDGGWNTKTPFPFIQGTDCCGEVVAVADKGHEKSLGKRVLIRPCMRSNNFTSMENIWMGSDFDGAFAQYVKAPASEVFPIQCNWRDAELGTIPCAYGTSENMIHRSQVKSCDHILVTGASGGVGSAAVQLAKRRGARVTAVGGKTKINQIKALGADQTIARGDDVVALLGEGSIDVVIDNVAGTEFGNMLKLLKRGGSYVSSGAIAGPIVELDMRTLYLKDITLIGCTAWDEPVFPNLISYIERGEIKPLLSKSFKLAQIKAAQKELQERKHFGKFVLIPD
ncbi:MAG: alcohol dehydrogenase family protein [Spirochaetes bacterium]|nr:alcohol dehydrogenase family protein [Spirochaetota bacterium]